MSIVLQGSTSGSVTLQEPAVAGTTVLDLPAVSGTILTTASSGQSIPKAALPTGSVLQVVSAVYSTYTEVQSTSFTDSGLTASITPTSSSSKILVILNPAIGVYRNSNVNLIGGMNIVRGSTQISQLDSIAIQAGTGSGGYVVLGTAASFIYLDSPATTSSTTYKMQMKINSTASGGTIRLNDFITTTGDTKSTITLMEIAA